MVEHPVQQEDGGSNPTSPLHVPELCLEFCCRTDPRYQRIRKRHYVVDRGTHGQQIHFLIKYKSKIVGIISGGSAVYTTAQRDAFFGIDKSNRARLLNGIIDNLLFRLELHEPNLATRILALWRKVSSHIWEDLYQVKIFGFETFIDEIRAGRGFRTASLYKADNWDVLGETKGNTKHHGSEGLTGGLSGVPFQRRIVPKKLIAVRWQDRVKIAIESNYKSSWRGQTTEEKYRAKILATKRRIYLGTYFASSGKYLFYQKGDEPWTRLKP